MNFNQTKSLRTGTPGSSITLMSDVLDEIWQVTKSWEKDMQKNSLKNHISFMHSLGIKKG